MGRPTKRTPEIERQIMIVLGLGFGIETAADFVGLNASTIHDWKKKDPDFSKTVKKAVATGRMFVGNILMNKIKKKDLGATIFWLKCRSTEFREYKNQTPASRYDMPPITTISECIHAYSGLAQAAGRGEITMEEMTSFSEMVDKVQKTLIGEELENEMAEIREMIEKQDR